MGSSGGSKEQSPKGPPKASLAPLAKHGIFVFLTWKTEHIDQRAVLIKATIMTPGLELLLWDKPASVTGIQMSTLS